MCRRIRIRSNGFFEKGIAMKKLIIGFMLFGFISAPVFAAEGEGLVARTLVKSTRSWDGSTLPAYMNGQPEITILRITIPPGARLPTHDHPVINAGVLLRGKLTVVTETGKTLHLEAGDPIVEVVGTWHYGMNEGETPAEIIVFYAGVEGTPITVKK
jgi:quercetin dioxygenase-like cupin family protein